MMVVAAGAGLIFPRVPNSSGNLKSFKCLVIFFLFYSHHNCPVVNILFINTKSSLAFFVLLNKNETL